MEDGLAISHPGQFFPGFPLVLDKVPLPLVKGIPSPGTKGLHDKAWHSSYPYYADRANCDPPIDNPTLHTNSEGKM